MPPVSEPIDLVGLPPDSLRRLVTATGGTPVQALNLFRALHATRPADVTAIPGVSHRLLERIATVAAIRRLRSVASESGGWRGTRKLLLTTEDDLPVEAVLFPTHRDPGRLTLCVSSQAGCRMGCSFCATGAMGFHRHLSAAEIVAQVWAATDLVQPGERLHNIVFMGMGEPLENYEAVRDAIFIMHDERGFKIAWDKISVSTVGLVPGMERLARELPRVSLALSLHATRDAVRDRLVPPNRKWGIEALLSHLRRFPRTVFCIEYCLIAGVNDGPAEGAELGRLLQGIRHKVHLIPCNPVPGLDHRRPTPDAVAAFAVAAEQAGASVLVRDSRGQDILAACGQLGAAHIGARGPRRRPSPSTSTLSGNPGR